MLRASGVDRGFAIDRIVIFEDRFQSFFAEHGTEGFDGAFITNGKLFGGFFCGIAIATDRGFAGHTHF